MPTHYHKGKGSNDGKAVIRRRATKKANRSVCQESKDPWDIPIHCIQEHSREHRSHSRRGVLDMPSFEDTQGARTSTLLNRIAHEKWISKLNNVNFQRN